MCTNRSVTVETLLLVMIGWPWRSMVRHTSVFLAYTICGNVINSRDKGSSLKQLHSATVSTAPPSFAGSNAHTH